MSGRRRRRCQGTPASAVDALLGVLLVILLLLTAIPLLEEGRGLEERRALAPGALDGDKGGDSEGTSTPSSGGGEEVAVDWEALLERYPDLAGWLEVGGTPITQPVMSGLSHGQDWFLHHDETGAWSAEGLCYLRPETSAADPIVLIVGHNMGPQSLACLSPLASCHGQGDFDGLGRTLWTIPSRQWSLEPLCALRLRASDPLLTELPQGQGLHPWLDELLVRAEARAQEGERLCAEATKVVVCVTCTGPVPGLDGRTAVVFCA